MFKIVKEKLCKLVRGLFFIEFVMFLCLAVLVCFIPSTVFYIVMGYLTIKLFMKFISFCKTKEA